MHRLFPAFALALLGLAANPILAQVEAPEWLTDTEKSEIVFVATQSGAPVEGRFKAFEADIRFDPAAPEAGRAEVLIEIASVDSGATDRDQAITSEGLLNAGAFPQGRFVAERFRHLEGDSYEAEGTLTLRDVTLPVVLPFTLAIDGDTAQAKGELRVQRLDYGVGQGQWADTSMVGPEVAIRIDILARRPN